MLLLVPIVSLAMLGFSRVASTPASAASDTATGPTVRSALAHAFLPQLCPGTPEPAPSILPAASTTVGSSMPAPVMSFDGTPALPPHNQAGFNDFPADPSGAVGPSDYVQSNNFALTIFTKTGTPRCPSMPSAAFWQPLGAPCYADWSDEVILYDRDAGRWFASRFAVEGDADQSEEEATTTSTAPSPPPASYQCFAISTSSDPTKSWQLYVFRISETYFADYPKFGIWPDAYFMSTNPNKIFSKTGVIATA